LTDSPDLES